MAGKSLLSVGLDVGTTTTQMILSRLTAENRAAASSVPKMEITDRQILYQSPVYFTPLSTDKRIDGARLRQLIEGAYREAGICRKDVDTGAAIITGESSRKENAKTVVESLSDLAGDFVVATAGPDLESALAARGAGALENSRGTRVLHMDIGGGTSNLCLVEDGRILATGCLNVGGRLLKFDETGRITYCSPVLKGITTLKEGQVPTAKERKTLARSLTAALEMAAGLTPKTELLEKLMTRETENVWQLPGKAQLSFSGGVADCIARDYPELAFGDLGPTLGRTIRESKLCREPYLIGKETIRATVIGAGCHALQLSGSTVFCQNLHLPLKNLPAAVMGNPRKPEDITRVLENQEGDWGFLAIPGYRAPSYAQVEELAEILKAGFQNRPVLVCLETDMAKVLGNALRLRLPEKAVCLCLDGLAVPENAYLDVGEPVGPAFPVVIKTLVFSGGTA